MSNENKHMKGRQYFIQAIYILKHDRTLPMMDVYKIIADMYNVTPDSVRKALTRYIRKFSYEPPARHFKKF